MINDMASVQLQQRGCLFWMTKTIEVMAEAALVWWCYVTAKHYEQQDYETETA